MQKFILLKKIGVDFVINKRFNLKFSKLNLQKFIKNIIVKKINPKLFLLATILDMEIKEKVMLKN